MNGLLRHSTPLGSQLSEDGTVVEPGFLQNPAVRNWLGGIVPAWTMLDPKQGDAIVQWTRDQIEAAKPHSPGGSYLNFPGVGADADAVREAYGPNYERLAKIKAKYDPANMFRMNQNIVPLA